jgi:hypothetical protein
MRDAVVVYLCIGGFYASLNVASSYGKIGRLARYWGWYLGLGLAVTLWLPSLVFVAVRKDGVRELFTFLTRKTP